MKKIKKINNRFFFSSSQAAAQRITDMFTLFWGIDAGLWNLRCEAKKYFNNHPTTAPSKLNKPAKDEIVKGLKIHGLNLDAIANGYTWEYEEEFLAEVLLIYATAIFDDWAENFVKEALPHCGDRKKKIVEELRQGKYDKCQGKFKRALSQEPYSQLRNCFNIKTRKQYNSNLIKLYKYFKSCRNCIAHGEKMFSNTVASRYQEVRCLKAEDLGMKEIPQMACSVQGEPFRLYLRGVVGFYDVLIRIITHLDKVAAERKGFDNQLCIQWQDLLKQEKMDHKDSKDIIIADGEGENYILRLSKNKDKLEREHRLLHYFAIPNSYNANIYEPMEEKLEQVYEFLKKKGCIKEVE